MVMDVLKPGGHLIVLIKPQFEAGKAQASRPGQFLTPTGCGMLMSDVASEGWLDVHASRQS